MGKLLFENLVFVKFINYINNVYKYLFGWIYRNGEIFIKEMELNRIILMFFYLVIWYRIVLFIDFWYGFYIGSN